MAAVTARRTPLFPSYTWGVEYLPFIPTDRGTRAGIGGYCKTASKALAKITTHAHKNIVRVYAQYQTETDQDEPLIHFHKKGDRNAYQPETH